MTERGGLITLEGVDGAGKSTHRDYVADRLRAGGRHVIVTREPGGSELGERLRELILSEPLSAVTETLLLFASRADHVERVIRPALEAGSWVVCDRFSDATAAYQGGGKGVPADLLRRLEEAAHPGLRPRLTLLFDCAYDIARRRLAATGKALDRFEREDRAFFDRVRSAYLARAAAEPERIKVIDASGEVEAVRPLVERALAQA